MKPVTFLTKIPDWANWKATDYYGNVWVFENEPSLNGLYWNALGRKTVVFQFQSRTVDYAETKARIS